MSIVQYNDKYKNVIYEGHHRRLYDERYTDSFDALFSETQIKFIELIEKYNFKIFYFKCSAKTNLKVEFLTKNDCSMVNLNNLEVLKIRELIRDDLYYLYENKLFEIIYTIPKLNNNNNYYFDFILIVNQDFNLNAFYNYNFNINKIISVSQINYSDITFELIKNIFNEKINFYDYRASNYYMDSDYYSLTDIDLKFEDYIKIYCNNDESLANLQEKFNRSSHVFYKNFNQNSYVKFFFKFLDMQVWSIDDILIRVNNDIGWCYVPISDYDVNSSFITNYFELMGVLSVELKNENKYEIKSGSCIYCSLSDNFLNQKIFQGSLFKFIDKNGFLVLDDIKTYKEEDVFEGQIIKK